MRLRLAGPGDAAVIARLHAASWQAHYRGGLSDAYLDGPVEEERRRVWADRFAAPDPAMSVILAEEDGILLASSASSPMPIRASAA